MECKFAYASRALWVITELIDTLWNVNKEQTTVRLPLELELIDTLWNVNIR